MRDFVRELAEETFGEPATIDVAESVDGMKTTEAELQEEVERILEGATVQGSTVQNVVVLTDKSRNQRRYTDDALDEAAEKAEGAQVYADHPDSKGGERSVHDLIGVLKGVRKAGKKVKGNLLLVDHVAKVKRLAKEAASAVGLSINARGPVRQLDDGYQVVEGISDMRSVDLVTAPAATSGLAESIFESIGEGDDMKSATRDLSEVDLGAVAANLFGVPYGGRLDETPGASDVQEVEESEDRDEPTPEEFERIFV